MPKPKYITLFAVPHEKDDAYGGVSDPFIGYMVKDKSSHKVYPTELLIPPEKFKDRNGRIPRDWTNGERKDWIEKQMSQFEKLLDDEYNYAHCHQCRIHLKLCDAHDV